MIKFESVEPKTPKTYEHQPYPSVRYHRSGATKLVHSDEESEAIKADPDWSDTPATFAGVEHAAPVQTPVEAKEDHAGEARAKSLKARKPAQNEIQ